MNFSGKQITSIAIELFRYGFVSLAALLVDFSCLLFLAKYIHYQAAAGISFILGGLVAYSLSVKFVFKQRTIDRVSTEAGLFLALGLIGLVVNASILNASIKHWSLSLPLAKGLAAGATFTCNFVLRKGLLFTRAQPTIAPVTYNSEQPIV